VKPAGISGILSPFVKRFRIKGALKYIKSGSDLLDIGCGFGEIIEYLPENVKYIGIEKDEYLWKYCKEKYKEKEIILGEAEEISKKLTSSFDVILLLSVIEHLKEPLDFLYLLKDLLKEKGKIIIYAPSPKAEKILFIFSKLGILSKIASKEHKNLFEASYLIEKLKEKGFKFIKKKNFFFGLSYLLVFEK